MKVVAVSLSMAGLILIGSCAEKSSYSGDGRLIDNGVTAPDHRYVIEVGKVDLARVGSATFKMAGLPRNYFVVGLQIPAGALSASGHRDSPADVSLEVVREQGSMVALVIAPLREWTWSNPRHETAAFVYLRESARSYFDSFTEHRYLVKVTVNVPDPSIPAGTLIVLKSAGWK